MKYLARKALLLTKVMVFLATYFPVQALAATYTVQGIKVDVTAETAVDAREESLKQAQVSAFNKLLRSIVLKEDQSKIPVVEVNDIPDFISDYSVSDEKLTGTRYLAVYQFSFEKKQVNQFLINYDIQPTVFEPRKILILPVLQKKETIAVGDDFWHNSWKEVISKKSDDFMVPLFDLEDQFKARIFVEQNQTKPLKELANKYGADIVFVTWLKENPEEENLYEVTSYVLDEQKTIPDLLQSKPLWLLEEDEIQNKIENIIEEFQEKEKHKAIHKKSLKRTLKIQSACTNLTCVNEVKNDLHLIKSIKEIKIHEVSNKKIIFDVEYVGKFKALQERLSKMFYNIKIENTGILIEKVIQEQYDNS